MINPWKVLNVHRKSSDAEIRDAYYELAREYHPDGLDGNTTKFNEACLAYKAIQTTKSRREFLKQFPNKDCQKCAGAGTVAKTKGLTKREYTACKGCGGAGVIIKEKENEQRPIELRGTSSTGGKRHYKKR